MEPGEFDLIREIFAPLAAGNSAALSLNDDAAILPQRDGWETVVSTDTMVSGVHFLPTENPGAIARRLLRVNLSDIAAMGAEPVGYFLNLSLPSDALANWLTGFAVGLKQDQEDFDVSLLGGDTTSTPGELTLSVTMFAEVPAGQGIQRSTAQPGDIVFVSGVVGDAMLGLQRMKEGAHTADKLVQRFQLPQPRLSLGRALRGVATAMADVSDGLIADLGHICNASGLDVRLMVSDIPLSSGARAAASAGQVSLAGLVSGGDDYELVFAAPRDYLDRVQQVSNNCGVPVTRIGVLVSGSGVVELVDAEGDVITVETPGYRHF